MRILEMVEGNLPTGPAAAALSSARALRARGHEIIWLVEPGARLALRGREAGFETVEQLSRSAAGIMADRRSVNELAARADAVHVHRSRAHAAALLALGAAPRRQPLVRTCHAGRPGQLGAWARWLVGRADRVAVRSRALAFEMREGAPDERLAVIPGGVDPEVFRPGLDGSEMLRRLGFEGRLVVGAVARLKPGRFLFEFVQAAAILAQRPECAGLAFAVLGKGDLSEPLERWLRGRKLADRVKLNDPRQDFMAALAMIDIGVVLSPGADGSARAALELAAMGKPLVAGRVGALADLLGEDGGLGRLVEPGSPREIAEAVAELAADAALRERLGAAARAAVEREHTLARLGERYEALFTSVLGRQP